MRFCKDFQTRSVNTGYFFNNMLTWIIDSVYCLGINWNHNGFGIEYDAEAIQDIYDEIDADFQENDQTDLVPHFIPSLVTMLQLSEEQKGGFLSQDEVLNIRDNAVFMMVSPSRAKAIDRARGYKDFDPGNLYEEWCRYKELMNVFQNIKEIRDIELWLNALFRRTQ